MSTEDQNKAVVTLNIGVDVDAFIEDMVSGNNHNEFMPNRSVELYNEKPDSLRNVDFVLTRAEAELLKGDGRVLDVRYGTKEENGIFFRANSTSGSKLFSKISTLNNTHYNWGIPSCINSTNPFVTTDLTYTHNYPVAGNGVDIVIQDSGILATHPEWLSEDGITSRLKQVDWPVVSGLSSTYTQGPLHYSDQQGHGTHVAGTAAGKLYGWAKNADLYAIKIFDTDAFGVSASFNMIRAWHNLKANTSLGYKRPTVVNMSWEYFKIYENITGGEYRGGPWSSSSLQSIYGMVSTLYNKVPGVTRYYHPVRVTSVDADILDCVNAGIILVAAAGNDAHKIDVEGGLDYDNFYTNSVDGTQYYHRGATPSNTAGVINIGSVKIAQPEGKMFSSNSGPAITAWAPGEHIMSAIPEGSTDEITAGSVAYPTNSAFKATKLSGTSMAAPQATGIIAGLLEARPEYNQANVVTWLNDKASIGRLSDTGGSYTDLQSLQGAPNKFLRQPFSSSVAWKFSGS
jgi:subtilisin family serine protease